METQKVTIKEFHKRESKGNFIQKFIHLWNVGIWGLERGFSKGMM